MSIDYYEILGLTRNVTDVDLKRAFRSRALKYHPQVKQDKSLLQEFFRICEAYNVLSNPESKGFFDLYGEEALKEGINDGENGTRGGFYKFNPQQDSYQVFTDFFGTSNPYEALNDISNDFEGLTQRVKPKLGKHKMYELEVTLEELFYGCLKRVHYTRRVKNQDSGLEEIQKKEATVNVQRGLPEGTRFEFEGEGNVLPGLTAGKVIFTLKMKPHHKFERQGDDIIYKPQIPLYSALVGGDIEVQTIDNRTLNVPITEIIIPGCKLEMKGEGMQRMEGGRGNLVVYPQLLFPTSLSEHQRMFIRAAFYLPPLLKPEQLKIIKTFETSFKDATNGWHQSYTKEQSTTAGENANMENMPM
eukprot:TRINITY_DN2026_c0_g2_i2.p1 TRINITY_DN2026_c0_g2~~TRINITY_DN2026_c0_g2_i2.p1  ORF type:complete len:359 (-),score=45.09 TRINITY_DN2026_c0_g2_i2:365-1441(-)